MLKWLFKRRLLTVALACLGVLALGATGSGFAAQTVPCRSQVPAIGPVLDTRTIPILRNFDPCTKRLTMTDDALKHTGGPYIGRAEAERRAVGNNTPTKVRSYLTTEAQVRTLIGQPGEATDVYPDREEWLVVVQAPDQGPVPSLPHGLQPWPRRYYYMVIDATTGQSLAMGGNGPNDGDWPTTLPRD